MPEFRLRQPETIVSAQVWTIETDTPEDPVSLEIAADGRKSGLLHTHDNQFVVADGDVIIRDKDGQLSVLAPDEFLSKYEQVPEAAPAKKLKRGEE